MVLSSLTKDIDQEYSLFDQIEIQEFKELIQVKQMMIFMVEATRTKYQCLLIELTTRFQNLLLKLESKTFKLLLKLD